MDTAGVGAPPVYRRGSPVALRLGSNKNEVQRVELTFDLTLYGLKGLDATYMADKAALYHCAKAVWQEPWAMAHWVMRRTYNEAITLLGGTFKLLDQKLEPHLDGRQKTTWWKVQRPAGAVAATLERIGWKTVTWGKWVNNEGTFIDLRKFCPRTVENNQKRHRQTLHKQIVGANRKPEFEHGIYLDPIVRVIDPAARNKNPQWTPQAAAHLHSTVVGAQWPYAGGATKTRSKGRNSHSISPFLG